MFINTTNYLAVAELLFGISEASGKYLGKARKNTHPPFDR
jgi:hypothetical protein